MYGLKHECLLVVRERDGDNRAVFRAPADWVYAQVEHELRQAGLKQPFKPSIANVNVGVSELRLVRDGRFETEALWILPDADWQSTMDALADAGFELAAQF